MCDACGAIILSIVTFNREILREIVCPRRDSKGGRVCERFTGYLERRSAHSA